MCRSKGKQQWQHFNDLGLFVLAWWEDIFTAILSEQSEPEVSQHKYMKNTYPAKFKTLQKMLTINKVNGRIKTSNNTYIQRKPVKHVSENKHFLVTRPTRKEGGYNGSTLRGSPTISGFGQH